jgi:Fe-S-cluster-containing dehydrogenase component
MMNYAMALDYQNCINCQACEVACKQENGVQLGAGKQRIWIGIVEGTVFGRPFSTPRSVISVLMRPVSLSVRQMPVIMSVVASSR